MSTPAIDGHIVSRFDAELQKLQGRVLSMGDLVKEQLVTIQRAVKDGDADAVAQVLEGDRSINLLELKTDKSIIRLLARRAPVGSDLRFVVAVSRMVTDLERLGDETIEMAKSLLVEEMDLGLCDGSSAYDEVVSLIALVDQLFDKVMKSFADLDEVPATEVAFGNAGPDGELRSRLQHLTDCTLHQNQEVQHAVNLMLSIRSLEKISDYIRNIGEHVIYLITAEDVRHQDTV
jgi:phosphate transport system protein